MVTHESTVGGDTKFQSAPDMSVPMNQKRNVAVDKARQKLSMRQRSGSGARLVMRDAPTTPMVQSNTNPLTKNRPPSGTRKTTNADLANELGMNPWDQKAPLKKAMELREASLNRLR